MTPVLLHLLTDICSVNIILTMVNLNNALLCMLECAAVSTQCRRTAGASGAAAVERKPIGMILETERLFLREMTDDDYDDLYAVLADSDIMQHYPYTFDEARVRGWIDRNRERYARDGFGLWAVCLKDTGRMIGDCGLTLQNIDGTMLPEIGYHIRRDCQRRGYAREAAAAVRDWAFAHTGYSTLYSYCKHTNVPSMRTAEAIGMHFIKEYPDPVNEITHVSAITRQEYREMNDRKLDGMIDNMITWAERHLGDTGYAGWCLSFA